MKIHSTCFLLIAVCLATPGPACGETLGRLFFSPAERLRIDRERLPPMRTAPPPRLDGFIIRSEGAPTLFLDGKAVPASPRQIHPQDASVSFTSSDGRHHRLQVGNPSPIPQP
ncbi:MAG: hypothetical protein JSR69_02245 [Proteobacteria bacterium]|nr:hypothetical protein [Pseudomonadota bacterium]